METTKKKRIYKSAALKELEKMANQEAIRLHPNCDPRFLAPSRYCDTTANRFTQAVIDFLRLSGHQAERINCTGRYIDKRKVFTDVLGHKRQIGRAVWIPTAGQKGTADISAVIYGRAVKIEIKINDFQSEAQKKYQESIEKAGGVYLLVRSFQAFYDWYQNFTR